MAITTKSKRKAPVKSGSKKRSIRKTSNSRSSASRKTSSAAAARRSTGTKRHTVHRRKRSVFGRLLKDNHGSIGSSKLKKIKFRNKFVRNNLTPLAVVVVVVVGGLSLFVFSLASTAISVSISGISAGGTTSSPITVSATPHNTTPTSIAFYLDGSLFATKTSSPYCMNGKSGSTCLPYNVANGKHTIKVIMTYKVTSGNKRHQKTTTETYTTSDSFTITPPPTTTTGTGSTGSGSTGSTGTTGTGTTGSGSTGGSGTTGTTSGGGTTSANPLAGDAFYVFPNNDADQAIASNPSDASTLSKIADEPTAYWITPQSPDSNNQTWINTIETDATNAKQVPVYVLYAIPYRDCGSYSAGGETTVAAYESLVNYVKAGIAGRKAVVIVEPDALIENATQNCSELTSSIIAERTSLFKYASDTLSVSGTSVYLDAGNFSSQGNSSASVAFIVPQLIAADVSKDAGFSMNVSGDNTTASDQAYGDIVSAQLAAKGIPSAHYVIDTSRNGNGLAGNPATYWCNLAGAGLGADPTTVTSDPLNDAYLWIKYPGESDGNCTGDGTPSSTAPASGIFWLAYAIGLVNGNAP